MQILSEQRRLLARPKSTWYRANQIRLPQNSQQKSLALQDLMQDEARCRFYV